MEQQKGVQEGDTLAVYQAIVTLLVFTRIGAVHSVSPPDLCETGCGWGIRREKQKERKKRKKVRNKGEEG